MDTRQEQVEGRYEVGRAALTAAGGSEEKGEGQGSMKGNTNESMTGLKNDTIL